VLGLLARLGFEPYEDGGRILLGNCPFHRLARDHAELVCGMNLAMFDGLVRARTPLLMPRLDPDADRCCVVLEAATPPPA
jgi:predicted ArsR family transcriptional regulator